MHVDRIMHSVPFNVVAYGHAVTVFHMRFIAAARRPYLVRLAQKLRNLLERYVRLAADDHDQSKDEHSAMVTALRAGDADTTGRLCRQHLEAAKARLMMILAERRHGEAIAPLEQ